MKKWEKVTWTMDGDSIQKLFNVLTNAQLWLPDEQLRKEAALLRCEIGEVLGLLSKEEIEFTRMIYSSDNSQWGLI